MSLPGTTASGVRIPRGESKIKRESLLAKMDAAGYDAEKSIIEIAQGQLTCLKCHGRCYLLYAKPDPVTRKQMTDENGDPVWVPRKCVSCRGTGEEPIDLSDVLKARLAIFDKIVPSLKQVDHSNDDGSLKPGWTMVFPKLMDLKPGSGKTPPMLQQKKEDL